MVRAIDEPIPPNERLYRAVREEWIVGTLVLPEAFKVGFPEVSFDREKYRPNPQNVATENLPRVVAVRVGMVPNRIQVPDCKPHTVEFRDKPREDNPAHAVARFAPVGKEFSNRRLKPKIKEKSFQVLSEASRPVPPIQDP